MKHRLPFTVLHEDRDLVVIDKPAGLLTTHTRAKEANTVEELLNDYVRKGQRKSRSHVWLVHRLDRETSGVLMFAKSEAVAETLRANWSAMTEKAYLARVGGVLEEAEGVFTSWLREDDDGYRVRSVPESRAGATAKFARTEWRRLSVERGTTLVEAVLKTGRKNQIRVHFSEAGHPVVGDEKYGGERASRMYLHAHVLRVRHPHSGEWLTFVSPPPRGLEPPAGDGEGKGKG